MNTIKEWQRTPADCRQRHHHGRGGQERYPRVGQACTDSCRPAPRTAVRWARPSSAPSPHPLKVTRATSPSPLRAPPSPAENWNPSAIGPILAFSIRLTFNSTRLLGSMSVVAAAPSHRSCACTPYLPRDRHHCVIKLHLGSTVAKALSRRRPRRAVPCARRRSTRRRCWWRPPPVPQQL